MNSEIIKNPNGTFAVYAGNKLIADHFKIRSDAESRARTYAAASAMGRIKSPAKSAACRENGKNGGRPAISTAARQRLMDRYDADKVRVTAKGEVHVHTAQKRGDGGPSPWWMFAGYLHDAEIREIIA